jgi:hypothetical protein
MPEPIYEYQEREAEDARREDRQERERRFMPAPDPKLPDSDASASHKLVMKADRDEVIDLPRLSFWLDIPTDGRSSC